jgi:hypothetical protein
VGFFSDLVKGVEADVRKILPTDGPHDTRELADIAKAAEGVADTLDPELEPLFATVGAAGDAVESALKDLGEAVGALHTHVAKRLATVPVTPVATEPEVPPTEPPAAPSPGSATPGASTDPTPSEAPAPTSEEAAPPDSGVPPAS